MQPGDTFTPGSKPTETKQQEPDQPSQDTTVDTTPEPESRWQFNADDTPLQAGGMSPQPRATAEVAWTASEYVTHQKGASWYALLVLGAVAGAVLVYLVTRDKISAVMILAVATILGVFAARKPRTLQYQIDNIGVHIGSRSYSYGLFKSFAVMDEGGISSISLTPLRRFMPPISMYYEPADEDKIVDTLSMFLPYEDRKHDAVDQLMRKLRF